MNYSSGAIQPATDETQAEIENFYFDLLIQDEELVAQAQKACEDILFMDSKMKQLDESSPAYEPLSEVMSRGVSIMNGDASDDYAQAIDAIEEINKSGSMTDVPLSPAALVALSSLMGGVLIGGSIASGGALALGAGAALAGGSMATTIAAPYQLRKEEVQAARQAIDEYIEAAKRIHGARTEFEAVWARIIEDEQPEELEV